MQEILRDHFSAIGQHSEDVDYIAIVGPTGVGKTSCAIQLAQLYPEAFEIISVDSVQVYRGLDIGSAKLPIEKRDGLPHHLIDICNPDERYTAASFNRDAVDAVSHIRKQGKIALLVGGTFLYLQAFQDGLSPVSTVTDQAIARVDTLLSAGVASAWRVLESVDPETAVKVNSQDRCRIERALLVYYSTQRPISEWRKQPRQKGHRFRGVTIAILPEDRQAIKNSLADRFDLMLQTGLVEEVRECWRQFPQLTFDHPSMRAIGYRQVSAFLHGHCDYAAMRHDSIIATRRYLKRQLTWLRNMRGICHEVDGLSGWRRFWGFS